MRRRLFVLPIVVAALACAPAEDTAVATDTAAPADTGAVRQDPAAARTAIEQIRDNWRSAAERDDAGAVAALYADDAIFVGTETPEVRGRAAIQETFGQQFPMSTVSRIESRDLTVSGDMAYDYGEFTQQVTPPNAPGQTINGHYLVVLRRQGDGSWRIVRHVSTTPTAAAAPAAR
ncbi:MAG TPA: SgcJ/EcaC family oxidoreductase [Gemmatimonadaceae bacterium]|nr:SgcJ/EcaC family oxidoreductase [Gemmatimonadaceae bacterium]